MKEILSAGLEKKGLYSEKTNLRRRDYHDYKWKRGERWRAIAISFFIDCFFSLLFYRSLIAIVPLAGIGYGAYLFQKQKKGKREKEELKTEFKECILSVSSAIQAGYSVENAFLDCEHDMAQMFGNNSLICNELRLIRRGLHINIALEELLADFGNRSDCEEIAQFAEVFSIAKRNGGNLPNIIKSSVEIIGRKIELQKEIDAALGGKRMELSIMEVMPFVILIYIELTSPGYFEAMYHNLRGIVIMTICLLAYLAAYFVGEFVLYKMSMQLE